MHSWISLAYGVLSMPRAYIPVDTLDKLYSIAEAQAGYFTTRQAEDAGVDRSQLSRYAAAGRVQRARHGVYRLTIFRVLAMKTGLQPGD